MIQLTMEQLIEHFVRLIAARDAKIAELDASLTEITHAYTAIIRQFNELSAAHKRVLEDARESHTHKTVDVSTLSEVPERRE